ncbi:MAG: carboxypeptidase regulatory-like domain-containing protein [Planctomycetes bacterium]|nr:carboxypeptidase regulatory-like domain-containing protein [Planctomycetota bacterium]
MRNRRWIGVAFAAVAAGGALLWHLTAQGAEEEGLRDPRRAPTSRESAASRGAPMPSSVSADHARSSVSNSDSTATADRARLRVLLAGGAPALGARVILYDGIQFLEKQNCDGLGEVAFASVPPTALILVERPNATPSQAAWAELPLEGDGGQAARTLRLPRGAHLSGVLTVDGAAPGEPIRIGFVPNRALPELELIPSQVLVAAGTWVGGRRPLETATTPEGFFEFLDLPENCSGLLQIPHCYTFAGLDGETRSTHVERPQEGMRLALERLPVLAGRLVEEGTGRPVRDTLQIDIRGPGGRTLSGSSSEDGTFQFCVPKLSAPAGAGSAPPNATYSLQVSADRSAKKVLLDREVEVKGIVNLGDILVPAMRQIEVEVLDRAGAAIPGAFVRIDRELGGPTDANGLARITCSAASGEAIVGAVGYRRARLSIANAVSGPIRAVLDASTVFKVMVESATDSPLNDLRLRLSAKAPLFEGGATRHDDAEVRAGAALQGTSALLEGGCWVDTPVAVAREVIFNGLQPGLLIELELWTAMGEPVARGEVTLRVEERKSERLRVEGRSVTLRGVVLDERGDPIPRAQVRAKRSQEDHESLWFTADLKGRFSLGPFFGTEAKLLVRKDGYAGALAHVPLDAARSEEVRITLHKGREIVLKLVEEDGTPVKSDSAVLMLEGSPAIPASRRGEHLVFVGVGPGRGLIHVNYAGAPLISNVEPLQSECQIVVPKTGKVDIRWRASVTKESTLQIRLHRKDADPPALILLHVPEADLASGSGAMATQRIVQGRYAVTLVNIVPALGSGFHENVIAQAEIEVLAAKTNTLELSSR